MEMGLMMAQGSSVKCKMTPTGRLCKVCFATLSYTKWHRGLRSKGQMYHRSQFIPASGDTSDWSKTMRNEFMVSVASFKSYSVRQIMAP